MTLPKFQSAIWVAEPGPSADISFKHDVPIPEPKPHEVLVQMECSGICHSDIYNMTGAHPMSVHIAGHEGVGHIVQLGTEVQQDTISLGQSVGVKWIHETCRVCAVCERDSTLCPDQHNSGRDRPGTLQQYVAVPADHITPIPDGISSEEAAPLLCAGLTLYSAISKTRTRPGDWLVLQGAGGGLGHIGIQLAAMKGLKVIAIDSEDKRDFCQSLGAHSFFSFANQKLEEDIIHLTDGLGAHASVCCVGAEKAYSQALRLLRRGGTLVCVGLPSNMGYTLPVGPMELVVRGLTVLGSSVGSEQEMQELLQLAIQGNIKPVIHVMPWENFHEGIELVKNSKVNGRIVVKMQTDRRNA